MARSVNSNSFPSQVVSDAEKVSYEYGLKVAKAIEQEWFNEDRNLNRYTVKNGIKVVKMLTSCSKVSNSNILKIRAPSMVGIDSIREYFAASDFL